MQKKSGFTVIELIITIAVLALIGTFFLIQRNDLIQDSNDEIRKSDVKNIYANLTQVYHKQHGFYPVVIEEKTLTGINKQTLYDTENTPIWESDSEYQYEPLNCNTDGECQNFILTVKLDHEKDLIKKSKN